MSLSSLDDVEREEERLHQRKKDLEKQKEELLVKAGKGLYCKNCGKFTYQSSSVHKISYCNKCYQKIKREREQKELKKKLIGAVVTDFMCDHWGDIEEIVLYKNAMAYTIEAFGDEEDVHMQIGCEKKAEAPGMIMTNRPGEKQQPKGQLTVMSFMGENNG